MTVTALGAFCNFRPVTKIQHQRAQMLLQMAQLLETYEALVDQMFKAQLADSSAAQQLQQMQCNLQQTTDDNNSLQKELTLLQQHAQVGCFSTLLQHCLAFDNLTSQYTT